MNNLCKSLILFVFAIASFWNVSAQVGQKELTLSLEECAIERSASRQRPPAPSE